MNDNSMGSPVPLSNVEFAVGYVGPGLRRDDGCGEEPADIATLDQRMSDWTTSGRQVLPADVSRRLLEGKGRLQAMREWRGLERAAMAEKLRFDEAVLARIEVGRLPLDADMVARIAVLLDVPADWIAG